MRSRRLSLALPLLVALLSLALAPSAGAQSGGSGQTVRIGLEAPLSGDQSSIGQGMLQGAQLAAERLNEQGGINGARVEIVPIDDAADPRTGVRAAQAAIAAGLDGVVGPYNSGVGAETLPQYLAAGLVPIRLTSADSTNGMGFTLQPMTYQIAPVAAEALDEWLDADSVAIVYDDSTLYTQTVANALRDELEAEDIEITAFEAIQPGARSYADTIRKVVATKPEVVYLATYYPEGGLMAKELYRQKARPKCLADYGSYDVAFPEVAGRKAARACPVVGVPAPDEFSGATQYVRAYRKRFGEAPGVWSPYTYDSVNFLAAGVEKAGSWDAAALKAALDGLTGFSGWTGPVTIDPATGNREPATVVVLRTDKRGVFHVDREWADEVDARI